MNSFLKKLAAGLTAVSLGSIASGCHVPGHGRPEVVKLKPVPTAAKVRPAVVKTPVAAKPVAVRPIRPTAPY